MPEIRLDEFIAVYSISQTNIQPSFINLAIYGSSRWNVTRERFATSACSLFVIFRDNDVIFSTADRPRALGYVISLYIFYVSSL